MVCEWNSRVSPNVKCVSIQRLKTHLIALAYSMNTDMFALQIWQARHIGHNATCCFRDKDECLSVCVNTVAQAIEHILTHFCVVVLIIIFFIN